MTRLSRLVETPCILFRGGSDEAVNESRREVSRGRGRGREKEREKREREKEKRERERERKKERGSERVENIFREREML